MAKSIEEERPSANDESSGEKVMKRILHYRLFVILFVASFKHNTTYRIQQILQHTVSYVLFSDGAGANHCKAGLHEKDKCGTVYQKDPACVIFIAHILL